MDIVLRISTITILIVIAFGVIAKPMHKPWHWTLCFIAIALGVSAFVLGNSTTHELYPNFMSAPWFVATFLAKMIVLFAWLFVQSCFDDDFQFDRFRIGVSLLWLATVLSFFWSVIAGKDNPIGFTNIIMALVLMAHLIWTLLRDREGDLRMGRRTARLWISAIMVCLLLMDILIDVIMGFDWRPDGFVYFQNGLILLAVMALCATILRVDTTTLAPSVAPKDKPKPLSEHAVGLDKIMTAEQLYLQPTLRLSDIVARLPLSEAVTRNLIHTEFGHGHFRSFLNQYRINHALALLRAPEHKNSKLIAIALDSGFASLASFQRAFKRETGQTASEWKAKHSKQTN
jgi:AraC-like DNA-binding protein